MTEYQEYPEYKDSGIEWLGRIPADWSSRQAKALIEINSGQSPEGDTVNIEGKGIPFIQGSAEFGNKFVIPNKHTTAPKKIADEGDLIMSVRAPVGTLNYAPYQISIGRGVAAIKNIPNISVLSFIAYCFDAYKPNFDSISKGTTFQAITTPLLKGIVLPLPPLETQQKIVEFLNAETAHIDAGIANMESLIALLTEKRLALISEVVTRGIPGDHTEFKDSGVAWLGEIPVEWEATDPKNLFVSKSMQSLPEDAHLMASQKYGVIPQADYLKNTGKRVVEVFSQDARFKHIDKDDFLIHLRSFQGGIEHCINTGKVTTAYTVVSPNLHKIFPLYAKYLLKSKDYISGLASTTNQLRDGQSIKWKDFRKVILPVPPVDEQKRIASFLEQELAGIELIAHEASTTIELLKEKRQTLISDVVTGKIDVRNSSN